MRCQLCSRGIMRFLEQAIQSHRGHVFKIIGDAFCAAFYNASDALAAALTAQRALQNEAWHPVPLRVRMGINTGAAEIKDDDYHGYLTPTRVQRVMSLAHGGQILLSNGTAELVRRELPSQVTLLDLREHRLKGLLNPERLWQVDAPIGTPESKMFTHLQSPEQSLDDFEKYVSSGRARFYKSIGLPLFPGKREGVRIYDLEGRPYINCRSSGGVFNLGHRPPRIVDALKSALDELDLGDHLLMSEWRARLAKKLASLTPGLLQVSQFVPGGGEAIDVALKLARAYTGRTKVIYAREGYHGHTGLALSATGDEFKGKFAPLVPDFHAVPFGSADALEKLMDEETAAVIFETIPATGGILIPPHDFYPRVRALCDKFGAVMIIDEVQTGLARTGRLWAIEEWGVAPDMMVLGKGMSGAIYPISVCTYTKAIDEFFADSPFYHLSSYAGSDLGCVVAYTMLDIITQPPFLENVRVRGEQFSLGLDVLVAKYPQLIRAVRQRGLMMGIELADDALGMMFTLALAHNGVLANYAGARPNTQIIMPPLIISKQDTDLVLEAMDHALARLVMPSPAC